MISEWQKRGRLSEADIRKWWTDFPHANVGLNLVTAELLHLDPDGPEGLAEVVRRGVPPTVFRTSRNPSYLYRRTPECPISTTIHQGESGQIDIMTNGQVIVYGKHRNGAEIDLSDYDLTNRNVATAPSWAIAILREASKKSQSMSDLAEIDGADEPPVTLSTKGQQLWDGQVVVDIDGKEKPKEQAGEIDRSATLFAIGGELAHAGATRVGISVALYERDRSLGYDKYSTRPDSGKAEYNRIAVKVLEREKTERRTRPAQGDVLVHTVPLHVNGTTTNGLNGTAAKPEGMLVGEETPSIPELPEEARLSADLAAGASPWLDAFVAWSQKWSPRSYPDFHEAVALWTLSTVAARRVVLNFGRPRYPSLYVALVARSSLFPKTTAADNARAVLRQAGLDWLLAPDESTPQRFISDLAGRLPSNFDDLDPDMQDRMRRRLALAAQRGWVYEEFGQHLSAMMREGSFMADWRGILRRLDDGVESYEYATIGRGSDYLEAIYLALLTTFTPADLKPLAGRGAGLWSDGFLARFAFATPPSTEAPRWERFPDGHRRVPDELIDPLARWHKRLGAPQIVIQESVAEDRKQKEKRILRDPLCSEGCWLGEGVVDQFYTYNDALLRIVHESQQTDLDASYARLAEKALRVAMLLASLENQARIEIRHWARAQQIAEHWRASLHHLYEQISEPKQDEDAEIEERILTTVRKLGSATPNDIVHYVRGLSRSAAKLHLDGLATAGLLSSESTRKGTPRYSPAGDEK